MNPRSGRGLWVGVSTGWGTGWVFWVVIPGGKITGTGTPVSVCPSGAIDMDKGH